jgi:cbb3-type cytochrome oxidase subunit 1
MNMLVRRVRGVLVTALVWAVAWLPVGLVVGVIRALTLPLPDYMRTPGMQLTYFLRVVGILSLTWMIWGAISGALFAVLVALLERRREVDTLSSRRTVIWGALGAMALPTTILLIFLAEAPGFTLIQPAVWTLSISAAQGAVCAFGTLALAKRGRNRLPPSSDHTPLIDT